MVWLVSIDAKINGKNSERDMMMNRSGKMFSLSSCPWFTTNPSGWFQRWMKPLNTNGHEQNNACIEKEHGFGINLDSEGQARRLRCVQLPGSDWAAGAVKMMTALSQRRRNSHFSGDREPAVAPSHPLGGNYGPWLPKKRKPRLPKQTTS